MIIPLSQTPIKEKSIQNTLKIVLIKLHPGQVMQFEDANERTTFADVAQHVFQSLGDGVKKLSLMAEYGGPFQFEMDQDGQICEIGNNSNTSNKESVELLTGFFSSRISCLVKDCINVDKIRILVNRQDNHFINVHCHVEDTVLDLKKRITAKIHTPVQQQRLSFKWNVLSNDQKIIEIDFGQGDEIQLDSDDRILDIKMPNGKQIKISVKNEERVKDICKRALQLENINEDGFYLHMNRNKMDKNKLMGEINFPSQSIITIQKKLMIVYSKDLIGKIMELEVESQDTIESVKQQIQKNDGIQSDQYRLIFNGQELEDGKTLNEYNIQDESTMIRVLKLSNLKTTNQSQQNEDVNQSYKMMKKQLIETAHDWCGIWPGLTIEGICENKKCQSYGQIVFYSARFTDFSFETSKAGCPVCNHLIKPIGPGFNSCVYCIEFLRIDGEINRQSWSEIGNKYFVYDLKEQQIDENTKIIIHTRKLETIRRQTVAEAGNEKQIIISVGNACNLCHEKQNKSDFRVVTLKCGHCVHRECMQKWQNRGLNCPLCDESMDEI